MFFELPTFNVDFQGWRTGNVPGVDPADFGPFDCQLYVNSRGALDMSPGFEADWFPPIVIRFPLGSFAPQSDDIYECEIGSGFYYRFRMWERVHLGFGNEYWMVLVDQCNADRSMPRT
jgi:hypothetical protein